MARQIINIGTTVNDRSGDPLRTAFDKANQNFLELYNRTGVTYTSILDAYVNNFTITTEQLVMVNNTGVASQTITLPANPTNGQSIIIKKASPATSWTIVINGNGKNIEEASTLSFNNSYGYVTLVYSTTHSYNKWFIVGGNYASV